jgi:hypothetical protein
MSIFSREGAIDCPDYYDRIKEALYDTYIASTSFDSEEIWEMWYESDENINTFIDSLNALEVQGLARMNELEDEE